MIDHLSLGVADLVRSRAFYDAALAPLGYVRCVDMDDASGYGPAGTASGPTGSHALAFWIAQEPQTAPAAGHHVCFRSSSRAAVAEFHRAALAAGGSDNGPPGLRPQYHPTYYAAFVVDPDEHRIEAVCHQPE
jgi:catechol 2,3-dioxygenase-like lactoylglutathione lyase family enzyme